MRAIFAVSLAALACTPVNNFTATTVEVYPARSADYPIAVLAAAPDRPYILIGYASCRGEHLDDALPHLMKRARDAGGDALMDIQTEQIFVSLKDYRAAVIRYTDGQAQAPAR